jgi:TIR domain
MCSAQDRSGAIFVSYRNLELELALRLAADLKNVGVHIWMDRLDGIIAGDDWRGAIEQAITNCPAMIAVLSPRLYASWSQPNQYCELPCNVTHTRLARSRGTQGYSANLRKVLRRDFGRFSTN